MKRAPHVPRAARAGFTIVEVVLAMLVLLLGMTTILGMLSFGAALARTAALRSGAAGSIEAIVADLEETLFPLELDEHGDEVAGLPRDLTDRSVPGYPGLSYSTHSRANPQNPLEYRVDVEMRWAVSGTTRSRSFTTLLLRQVSFGERLRQRLIEKRAPEKPKTEGKP